MSENYEEEAPSYEIEARELCREIQAQIGGEDGLQEEGEEETLIPELADLRAKEAQLPAVTGAIAPFGSPQINADDRLVYYVTRRRIVERFMILGYGKEAIAKALSLPLSTVDGDIAWIKAEAATVYDVERIRLQVYGKYQQMTDDVEKRLAQLDKALNWDDAQGLRRKNPALIRARSQMAETRERHVYNSARMFGVPTTTIQHKSTKYTEMLGSLAKLKTITPKE
jgi:hypothetical protein